MTQRRSEHEVDTPEHSSSRKRRIYEKPQIVHLEALEAVAADCSVAGGKGDPTCIVGFS